MAFDDALSKHLQAVDNLINGGALAPSSTPSLAAQQAHQQSIAANYLNQLNQLNTKPPNHNWWLASQAHSCYPPVSGAGTMESPPPPMLSIMPLNHKITAQIQHTIHMIPIRVAARIRMIDFYLAYKGEPDRFVVTYANGKQSEFLNVDAFPTEADIAQITLECPS